MADEQAAFEVTLDAASVETEEASKTALRVVRARSLGEAEYRRELEETVRALVQGADSGEGATPRQLAARLLALIEAFAALAATSIAYAGGKLGVRPEDLLAAIGETVRDARRQARAQPPWTTA